MKLGVAELRRFGSPFECALWLLSPRWTDANVSAAAHPPCAAEGTGGLGRAAPHAMRGAAPRAGSGVRGGAGGAQYDVGHSKLPSAGACCKACGANDECVQWAYHAPGSEQDSQCHLHSKKATLHQQAGTQAGVMRH